MNKMMICAMACAAVRLSFAEYEVQNWAASPASGVWSTSAANWEGGVPWTPKNGAAFGASSIKSLTLDETASVSNIAFNADGYRIGGAGTIEAAVTSAGNDTFDVTAKDGVTGEIAVPVILKGSASFRKYGPGTVAVSADSELFRISAYGGTTVVKDAKLTTAKIECAAAGDDRDTTVLVFDGATLAPFNNNTTLGADGIEFKDGNVQVGAGGLSVATKGTTASVFGTVDWMRLNQPLCPFAGLEDAVDGGFTMNGDYRLYLDMAQTSLAGGFRFLKGSSYLKYAAALGSGPVTLDANLFATNSMAISNAIAFGPKGKLGVAAGAEQLKVSNLGFAEGNDDRHLRFASENGGGEVRIIAGDAPVAVSGIDLSGGVALAADGATVKALSDSTEFVVDRSGSGNPITVGAGGLVFDTDGHDVRLGASLAFPCETEIQNLGRKDFANYSFETASLADWSSTPGIAGGCGAYDKTSLFIANYPRWKETCHGNCYAVLRSSSAEKTATLSQTFSVDADGEWTIEFLYATRPSFYTAPGVALAVYLDRGTDHEVILREMAADNREHPFELFRCGPVELKAGETHTLTFVGGLSAYPDGNSYQGNDALLIDAVRVSGTRRDDLPKGFLTKTGAGTLTVPSLADAGTVTVSAGTLSLAGAVLSAGSAINVSAGATLALPFSAAIPNANFEEDIGADELRKDGVVAGWSLTPIGTADLGGTQGDGSPFSLNGPRTTEGNHIHTAFLRPQNALETENVKVPRTGDYVLSFECARRPGSSYDAKEMNITVKLDGAVAMTVPSAEVSNSAFARKSCRVTLSAGTHALRFEVDGDSTFNGPCVFIDAVRLDAAEAAIVDEGGALNFARGATFDIGAFDVRLENVFVDGQKINGGRSALKAAGVTVVGTGKVHVGDDLGLMLIFR